LTKPLWSIQLLAVGRSEIPGPELFWMRKWNEWLPLTFQVALIRGKAGVLLVNTGPGRDLKPLNRGWEAFLGKRAALTRADGEYVLDQLQRAGVGPKDITHVVLTPLQLYTLGNILEFANARICIAERGWTHFHRTHTHPHDDRATSIPDEILVPLVTSEWSRVWLLEDEAEILPGVRTWWTGGHHRASLCVDVDTRAGVVAIGDAFFYHENLEENHPIGISESVDECLAAYARVRRTADLAVPLYDPSNFERYPLGRIG